MSRVVMVARVPVAIPDVEVACYDDSFIQASDVVTQYVKGSLVAVGVYVDYKAGILVIVEGNDVDVTVVDNIELEEESELS